MHSALHQWAIDWQLSPNAVLDLLSRLGMGFEPNTFAELEGWSESAVQNKVRLDAGKVGILAWRNNVGALPDASGRWVRYGLCNDTKGLNDKIKSADLIGIKPTVITLSHVGQTIGQFWSREVKEYGWKFTGTEREIAQQKWAQIVISKGGDAAFTTGAI